MDLDGELTIYHAVDLKRRLLAALSQAGGGLELDLASVTEIDTAGLQVLMLLKREAAVLGRPLRLLNHSPAVIAVFELLNLASFFGDPLLMTGDDA